jgi:hypothetical protein
VEERKRSMLERVRFRVGRMEVGNVAKKGLGVVQDRVSCFAQAEMDEGGSKAFLVDRVELVPALGVVDERQNGGGKNVGSPREGCRYRRMM